MDSTKRKKLLVSIAVGAIGGFAVIYPLMRAVQMGILGELDLSRSMAAIAGALYILCGAFVGFGTLSPNVGAKLLNVEDAEELREQTIMLRYSAFGILAFGLCLILLAFAAPLGVIRKDVVAVAIVMLFGLTTFTSWRQMQAMDELNATLSRETAASAFYLTLALGGGWSIAAHLGYASPLAALDWLTLFAAVLLLAAFWVSGRRGLLTPR